MSPFGRNDNQRRTALSLAGCWLAWLGWCIASTAPALHGADFTLAERTLTVAEGFEIELVAAPPLIERPIAVARDEQGALYVTDSAGMSDKADVQLEKRPHRIRRLVDRDGDGRYDQSTVFADRLMFPEGCLWYDGSLYVAAPPQIWKFTDADADGAAEQRQIWFDGGTLTGCANDLHGPYLGPDGWFYWCKGAFAEQRHRLGDGSDFVTRASHIFRARPDGSGLEPVLAGGMDNPVNVAFLSTGERILSCTFFQHPEAGRRDGLIHAIYGGLYGKRHDALLGHPQTGDLLPVLVHQGAAAPCGLTAGSTALWGGGYRDDLLACYFNLHKVVRHTPAPRGATYVTTDEDLVACDHPDFHPTDVMEDADGSLLVVDTGGWYKICCPTSQLAKPDVLGAIYRIRRRGAQPPADPLGTTLAWESASTEQLAAWLADERLFVQRRASRALQRRGTGADDDETTAALAQLVRQHPSSDVRLRAVWAAAGLPGEAPVTQIVLPALADRDPRVVQAACHVASVGRHAATGEALMRLLQSPHAHVVRAAAEALGRLRDARAVPALLQAVEQLSTVNEWAPSGGPADDAARVLEHSLIYALYELNDAAAMREGLKSPTVMVRRAALVALSQRQALTPADVLPWLSAEEPPLRRTAIWIASRRPDWGAELVAHYRQALQELPDEATPADAELPPAQRELAAQLAALAAAPEFQELLDTTLRTAATKTAARQVALHALELATLSGPVPAWLATLAEILPQLSAPHRATAMAACRRLPRPKQGVPELRAALAKVGAATDWPIELRLSALVAAGSELALPDDLFRELLTQLAADRPAELRAPAADILATAALTGPQQEQLAQALATVSPLELPRVLPAFQRQPNEALGLTIIAALQASPFAEALRADLIRTLVAKYPAPVREAAVPLLTALDAEAAAQAERLDTLLRELPAGDIRRGHAVFAGKKVACLQCHTLGYHGGRLGPDLTNIGRVRNERDLLESILFPSASFVRSYEPVVAAVDDGRAVVGIVTQETSTELTIATGPQQTVRLSRSQIEAMEPGGVSLMPQGIDKILTRQELADLLAFLKANGQ